MTPLLWPLWWHATLSSFSTSSSFWRGNRRVISSATPRPTAPPPMMITSYRESVMPAVCERCSLPHNRTLRNPSVYDECHGGALPGIGRCARRGTGHCNVIGHGRRRLSTTASSVANTGTRDKCHHHQAENYTF